MSAAMEQLQNETYNRQYAKAEAVFLLLRLRRENKAVQSAVFYEI